LNEKLAVVLFILVEQAEVSAENCRCEAGVSPFT